MRIGVKLLAFLMSLTFVTGVASAAVKTGDTCKKVGATATANGKKYTCIKSGKKLVWNKGIAIAKPRENRGMQIESGFKSLCWPTRAIRG